MAVDAARLPVQMPPQTQSPSLDFIKTLEKGLIERYRYRNQDFQTLVNAWHGVYYDNADTRYDMDTQGRPLLRVADSSIQNVPETLNVIKGFADAYKRVLVHLPDVRIPRPPGRFAPDLGGQRSAEEYQSRMKRAAYGIWDASQMEIAEVAAGWWAPVCGSHGVVVVPDFERGHAVIQYVAPWDIYGIGKAGDDYALSRCIISVDQDIATVQSTYGEQIARGGSYMSNRDFLTAASSQSEPNRNDRTIRNTIYLDENWFVHVIGDREVGRHKHDLGFCPGMMVPFIMLPQYVNRGHSAIEQLLPMQLSINFAVTLWEEGFKDSVLPTTWVRGAANIPANFARGRGQVITVDAEGAIGELGGRSAEAMRTVSAHTDLMIRFMELNSGVSRPQLEGRISGGGPTSGRGLDKAQGPYLANVEEVQRTRGFFMSKALKMAFDMTANHDFWGDAETDQVGFSGTFRGQDFFEQFTRAELKGVPTPDMSFAPMAHLGLRERVTEVLQLLGAKPPLISWDAAVDMIGLVRDHPNLRSEIESDLAWRYQIMQKEVAIQSGQGKSESDALPDAAQKAAQIDGGQTQPVPPAAPATIPPSGGPVASAPAAGAPAAPGAPAALPQAMSQVLQQPPEAPPPQKSGLGGDPVQQIRSELAAVKTTGEVLMAKGTVYVDWKDKAAVTRALEHHPEIKVKVKSKDGANVPKGAAVVSTQKGVKGAGEVGEKLASVRGTPPQGSQ